jgi:PKD repeat protein
MRSRRRSVWEANSSGSVGNPELVKQNDGALRKTPKDQHQRTSNKTEWRTMINRSLLFQCDPRPQTKMRRQTVPLCLLLTLPWATLGQTNFAPAYVFTTLAGSAGNPGSSDGTGVAARFNTPVGAAVDANGNVYVADEFNNTIRKVTATGTVTTYAGSAGTVGSANGTGTAARFSQPVGVAADNAGNVYVADSGNETIRKISPSRVVTTLAGAPGVSGSANGSGGAARFDDPTGLAVDSAGNVYVGDTQNDSIRKITPDGVVTTLAGGAFGTNDGTGSAAGFYEPHGVAVDANGNVYVADYGNGSIRKITPAGVVTTLAGGGAFGSMDGQSNVAEFNGPDGVATDTAGNVYVADTFNSTIRKVTPAGVVTTLGGLALSHGAFDGPGGIARFYNPQGLTVDTNGNIYVADSGNGAIRKGSWAPYDVQTTALPTYGDALTIVSFTSAAVDSGTNAIVNWSWRFGDGASSTLQNPSHTYTAAALLYPVLIATNSLGDTVAGFVPSLTINYPTPYTFATVAGSSQFGTNDGTGRAAQFYSPYGIALDSSGNAYVADTYNHAIRLVTSAGVVTTFAGTPGNPGSVDGAGSAAQFDLPVGLALDTNGNVYVGDSLNSTIRKITPTGIVTTLAGRPGVTGSVNGVGTNALFNNPRGLALDTNGNLYVADTYNNTVRKITPAGVVTTFAGSPGNGGSLNGVGSGARFYNPMGVAAEPNGTLFVVDTANDTIRKITPAGVVTTIAGSPNQVGSADGAGAVARFYQPNGLAVDAGGNVYVADSYNETIRKVTPTGVVTTLAGLAQSPGNIDGTGIAARFNLPTAVAVNSAGTLYVTEAYNNVIRRGIFTPFILSASDAPTNGIVPLTVQFTATNADSGGNPITQWNWDFGDGSTSALQNPAHTYEAAGGYYPTLVAGNSAGNAVGSSLPAIAVTSPTVAVTATPTFGYMPLTVQFAATNVDSGGNPITHWNWDFGDGATSAEQNPSHTYEAPGYFFPSLIATNAGGFVVYSVAPFIFVEQPVVQFTADPLGGVAPLTVQFTGPSVDSVGTPVNNWDWSFGDGGVSAEQSPTHIYEAPGYYFADLLVTNSTGSYPVASLGVLATFDSGLVVNGGFETGDFSDWTLDADAAPYDVVDFVGQSPEGIQPLSGGYFARLGQTGRLGYLSQSLSTTAGETYLLSLWLNSADGNTPNAFAVSWDGDILYARTNLPAFNANPTLAWTNLQFFATASTTNTVLQFGFRDDVTALGLDDVSAVPARPSLAGLSISGANLVAGGSNGLSGKTYVLLAGTNLSQPISQWMPVATAIPDTNGYFTLTATNGVDPSVPHIFYVIGLQPWP